MATAPAEIEIDGLCKRFRANSVSQPLLEAPEAFHERSDLQVI